MDYGEEIDGLLWTILSCVGIPIKSCPYSIWSCSSNTVKSSIRIDLPDHSARYISTTSNIDRNKCRVSCTVYSSPVSFIIGQPSENRHPNSIFYMNNSIDKNNSFVCMNGILGWAALTLCIYRRKTLMNDKNKLNLVAHGKYMLKLDNEICGKVKLVTLLMNTIRKRNQYVVLCSLSRNAS